MNLNGKKINFMGDSITEGVGTSSEEKIYLNLLKERAGLACARNYGVSCTRIAAQKYRSNLHDEQDFCTRVKEMSEDADIVVVFGGTNDFGHGDAPLGTFYDRTEWTFSGACHVMMRNLIERYPFSQLVIMTPLHRADEDSLEIKPNFINHVTLEDYVNILAKIAGYYSIPVLDLYKISGIQPSVPVLRELYCPDGVHPNDAGHSIIAQRLESFLRIL